MTCVSPIVDRILERLERVQEEKPGQWEARCPAHDDNRNSLSIGVGDDGRALLRCQAGCSTEEILERLRLEWSDLFPERPKGTNGTSGHTKGRGKIVASYDYRDERGVLLIRACRFEPKDFRQCQPKEGGGWNWRACTDTPCGWAITTACPRRPPVPSTRP